MRIIYIIWVKGKRKTRVGRNYVLYTCYLIYTYRNKIQEAVESTCKKLNAIHNSILAQIRKEGIKNGLLSLEPISQKKDSKLNFFDAFEITKYSGKFFEIDIPQIIKKNNHKKKIITRHCSCSCPLGVKPMLPPCSQLALSFRRCISFY